MKFIPERPVTPERSQSWNFQQTCYFLGIGRKTLKRLVAEGRLKAFRIPGSIEKSRSLIRFRRSELLDFLKRNRIIPKPLPVTTLDWTRTDVLPKSWAAALLGTDEKGLSRLVDSGRLAGRRIGQVRDFIGRREAARWERAKRREQSKLEADLRRGTCPTCGNEV